MKVSYEYEYSSRFVRSFKKLSVDVQAEAHEAINKFRDSDNHEGLRLHKLTGKLKIYHSFSINFQYRILIKIDKTTVYFTDIGNHNIYKS